MLNVLLFLFWMIILPSVIGSSLALLFHKKIVSLLNYLAGFLIMGGIFQLCSVHVIYERGSLSSVISRWQPIMLILFAISALFLCYNIIVKYKHNAIALHFPDYKQWISHKSLLICFFCIILQLLFAVCFTHIDDDDSRFIASAVIAAETDAMYTCHPITGESMTEFTDESYKDVTSPLTIFYALLSRLTSIHPTIIAHTLLPAILILIYYAILYHIGLFLFQSDLNKIGIFMAAVCFLNIWGFCSVYTPASFLLLRSWQGKSIVANIMIPFIFLCFMKLSKKYNDFYWWIALLLCMLFSCLCSGIGIALPIILVGISGLLLAIRKKKFSILLLSGLCCIPNMYYGLFYYKIMSSVLWLDWTLPF